MQNQTTIEDTVFTHFFEVSFNVEHFSNKLLWSRAPSSSPPSPALRDEAALTPLNSSAAECEGLAVSSLAVSGVSSLDEVSGCALE